MFDPTNPTKNRSLASRTATLLSKQGMPVYDAATLGILGALPDTDGLALHQAALQGQRDFDTLTQVTLAGGGHAIQGCNHTAESAFSRAAALGFAGSPQPVAFHCFEDGCHARVLLMLDALLTQGFPANRLRRLWLFSERTIAPKYSKLRPTDEAGQPLLDYAGVPLLWDYHVAVGVFAFSQDGLEDLLVIDPSFFFRLVSLPRWLARLNPGLQRPNLVQVAELGVKPIHLATGLPFPDGDYVPFALLGTMNPMMHARRTMVEALASDAAFNRPDRPLPVF